MKAFACSMVRDEFPEFVVLASSVREAVQKMGGERYYNRRNTVHIRRVFLRPLSPQDPDWEKLQHDPEERPLTVYEKGETHLVLPFSAGDEVVLFIKEVPLLGGAPFRGHIGASV